MVKFFNYMVVFEEIPNEITLAINITNCPNRCVGCHSSFLQDDIGTELTEEVLDKIIKENDGITCVCFMGGDREPQSISYLADYLKSKYENLKVGWYSGKDKISEEINLCNFDFIKIGHYDEKFGPLNKKTTNQRLYKIEHKIEEESLILKDITQMFWR